MKHGTSCTACSTRCALAKQRLLKSVPQLLSPSRQWARWARAMAGQHVGVVGFRKQSSSAAPSSPPGALLSQQRYRACAAVCISRMLVAPPRCPVYAKHTQHPLTMHHCNALLTYAHASLTCAVLCPLGTMHHCNALITYAPRIAHLGVPHALLTRAPRAGRAQRRSAACVCQQAGSPKRDERRRNHRQARPPRPAPTQVVRPPIFSTASVRNAPVGFVQ